MSITIEEAKAEVAKLKIDLVERLDRFHRETGLILHTGINVFYLEMTQIGDPCPRYSIDHVEFDVKL